MNKVFMIGNLTRDPELKQTSNGIAYCRFTIAVNRKYANADGERQADFFNVIAWRGTAEHCHKYLAKGSKVSVVGSLGVSNYEAQDGTKRTQVDITVDEVEFLTKKEGNPYTPDKKPVDVDDSDLPF